MMSMWEIGTWLACIVLGPGALAIFLFFLRDARKMLQGLEKQSSDREVNDRTEA